MGKEVIFVFALILSFSLVSAAYDCSEGNPASEIKVIDFGDFDFVNRLGIAVIDSSFGGSAEILTDPKKVSLTDSEPSADINLVSGEYTIEIFNTTDEGSLYLEVEGKKEKIDVGDVNRIDGLQVYLSDFSGTYPNGTVNVDLIVGLEYFFFFGESTMDIATLQGKKYGVELTSSSSNAAQFRVTTCESGNLIEVSSVVIEDEVENVTGEDETFVNESGVEEGTGSVNVGSEDLEETSGSFAEIIRGNLMYVLIGIVIVIIIIFFLLHKLGEDKEGSKERDNHDSIIGYWD